MALVAIVLGPCRTSAGESGESRDGLASGGNRPASSTSSTTMPVTGERETGEGETTTTADVSAATTATAAAPAEAAGPAPGTASSAGPTTTTRNRPTTAPTNPAGSAPATTQPGTTQPGTAPAPGTTPTTARPASALPALPAGWPRTLELGSADAPGGAAALRARGAYGFRYQYLAGGVNTGSGWSTWNPNGTFASNYIQESRAEGIISVFTYYQLFQSAPGGGSGEQDAVLANLGNATTMAAYYDDLKLFFQRAGGAGGVTVLHVEPDLWAYLQQKANGDDAATVPAKVGSTGIAEVAGLPDNASGFARAIVALRDRYAPNVLLGYHFSTWGTGNDFIYSDPSDAAVEALGVRTARFATSLGTRWDIAFTDLSDRDAAFKQFQYNDGGAAWYTAADYRRSVAFIRSFVKTANLRAVIRQIPLGNTKMRAQNNTWNHYQDNKVEWLLDDATRSHLADYTAAGVAGLLFGRGSDGVTCACDANNDGVTNPAPINGNDRTSLTADDDGGFFADRVRAYNAAGALNLV